MRARPLTLAAGMLAMTAGMLAQAPTPAPATPAAGTAQTPGAGRGGRGGGSNPPRYVEATPIDFNDHAGWTPMFDGTSLKGWDGPTDLWRVEDGAIVVQSKADPPTGPTYMVWDAGGEVANFEFKWEVKLEGARANGGVMFRATKLGEVPDRPRSRWETRGYQADYDNYLDNVGALIECCSGASRPTLPRVRPDRASAGQVVRTAMADGQLPSTLMTFGDRATLMKTWKVGEWNQAHLIARGSEMLFSINGQLMSVLIDDHPTRSFAKGWITIQLEGGGENKASFRNLWIKKLP